MPGRCHIRVPKSCARASYCAKGCACRFKPPVRRTMVSSKWRKFIRQCFFVRVAVFPASPCRCRCGPDVCLRRLPRPMCGKYSAFAGLWKCGTHEKMDEKGDRQKQNPCKFVHSWMRIFLQGIKKCEKEVCHLSDRARENLVASRRFSHSLCVALARPYYASMSAWWALRSINSRRGPTSSPISMENIWSASAAFSMVTCLSRRVSGRMVVSQSCSGFISPRPL